MGRLRHRRRERARAGEGGCRLGLPVRRGRRRRAGARGASRLDAHDRPPRSPHRPRRASGRRSRAKARPSVFDELLGADVRWRELAPQVDELRARTKLKGKPTPEQLEELHRGQGAAAARSRPSFDRRRRNALPGAARPRAEPAGRGHAGRRPRRRRRGGEGRRRSAELRLRAADHLDLSAAHGWIDIERGAQGVRLALRAIASATSRCSRSRCTAGRSTGSCRRATCRCCRRCSCARRRCTAPASSRPRRATSTRCPRTASTSPARPRCRSRLPHGRDPRRAAAALRRVLDVLPPRGRRGGQGHARDVPRAPVRQGRDVRLLRAGCLARGARAPARDRGGARPGARPSLSRAQHRRRRSRRVGCEEVRHRGVVPGAVSATARSPRRRTRPTSRRAG